MQHNVFTDFLFFRLSRPGPGLPRLGGALGMGGSLRVCGSELIGMGNGVLGRSSSRARDKESERCSSTTLSKRKSNVYSFTFLVSLYYKVTSLSSYPSTQSAERERERDNVHQPI